MSEAVETVGRLIGEWRDARAQLVELERAEHPDIVDGYRRTWTWKPGHGDVYVHDGMAVPKDFLTNGGAGLPQQSVLDNPNYGELCGTCLDGRERNVPDCRPEWNCAHVMHQD